MKLCDFWEKFRIEFLDKSTLKRFGSLAAVRVFLRHVVRRRALNHLRLRYCLSARAKVPSDDAV